MSLFNSVRNVIVPVHKEGYPFVAGFFVASLVLGWIFKPLFWIGLILTLWCAYFFRDPERMTPQDDDLAISPADGKVSGVQMVTPPAELNLGSQPMLRISVFMNVFDCHVNRSPMRGRITNIAYRQGSFLNAELTRRASRTSAMASLSRQSMARSAWCRSPAWSPAAFFASSIPTSRSTPANASA